METKNELDERIDPVWTIWVPLGVTIFLVTLTAVSYVVVTIQGGEISKWASAFTVLSLITLLLTSILTSAILMFAVGGFGDFSSKFPEWMKKAQVYSTMGNEGGKRVMSGLTKPVVLAHQVGAGFKRIFNR
jgi:hypothetical protein